MGRFLRSLKLADRYRSDVNNVVEEFYLPCLSAADRYDRAVGYFTSGALQLVARGLENFERSGGRIRLIASPYLNESDIEQIRAGYAYRDVVNEAVIRELDPGKDRTHSELAALGLLGRLVANHCLDIKIAIVRSSSGLALYHEKIGVFVDKYEDVVSFNGSLNETASAFVANFESIEVFLSWRDGDRARALRLQRDFEELWSGRTASLEVLDFPEAARDRLVSLADRASTEDRSDRPEPTVIGNTAVASDWARVPSDFVLRDYQKEAVDAWLSAGGRGMFRMATGTGKTVTALAALDQLGRQLRASELPLLTVVIAPLLDLVEQWSDELRRVGVYPVKCRDATATWAPAAHRMLTLLEERGSGTATFVVTNQTFSRDAFQQLLTQVRVPLLVIADEAHHLGSEHLRTSLPDTARFRLALSATPERWFDPVGTDALTDYFGDILIDLGLAEAIQRGALTHYVYTPVLVPLDHDETSYYAELTSKIGALLGGMDPETVSPGDNSVLGELLRRRSQILGHARGKLPALERELVARRDTWYQLVYCAEGKRPSIDGPTGERQVDAALKLVGNELGLSVHPFTSAQDKRLRARLLERFSAGDDLRLLVSMRCLDEGVDVPDARVAYMLASSTNPRQFVQRRGRILRRAPGKERAEVIDFVAVPPQDQALFTVERALFRRELSRCLEFAQFADNYGQALATLRPLRDYYGLMDAKGMSTT
jgi:superfamily II DNA or RNA helicase/HKD family nuclease